MSDTATETRPTYGNWITQRSPGLLGAGTLATALMFVGIVAALLVMMTVGPKPALVVAAVAALAFTAVGTPIGARTIRRATYGRAKRAGDTRWQSGLFTKNRNPSNRLPGTLGRSELLTATDAFGNEFAVVKNGGLWSIVTRCAADGPWMQDQNRIDSWVANYSLVLAACGAEPGIVCAKAITDTAPDPGGRLGAMVRSLRVEDAPDLARAVMDECVTELPGASSENVTYLELTFRGRDINRKVDQGVILTELARKVPGVIARMQAAGGGSVEMVTADELARIVRVAYDPVQQPALEAAEVDGSPEEVTWDDAGPVAYVDLWGDFVHDSGRSISWEMHKAPTSKITELALSGLLAPHSDFARKRVALVYQPHTPDQSAKVAERDANTANFLAQQGKKRPSAASQLVMRASEQSRQEVASGAASIRFSLLVTATVLYTGDVDQAASTLESRAGAVPIRLRRCYGAQAAAFAATLPVGFIPWEHTMIPQNVREWL